jgi:hypothetical protein
LSFRFSLLSLFNTNLLIINLSLFSRSVETTLFSTSFQISSRSLYFPFASRLILHYSSSLISTQLHRLDITDDDVVEIMRRYFSDRIDEIVLTTIDYNSRGIEQLLVE